MNKKPSLCIEKLSFHKEGRDILQDVSFKIYPGDFVVLLGGNGSGKSSLLKCINGLYRASFGSIFLHEETICQKPVEHIAQNVSTATQKAATLDRLTVLENCRCACKRPVPKDAFFQESLEKLHSPLSKKLHMEVSCLSGGEKQLLALAMCLYKEPKLLLLDEHTSALDPVLGKKVMEITAAELQKRPKLSVIMTSHKLDDALKFGNRLFLLKEGKLAFEAAGEEKKRCQKEDLLALYTD